MLRVIGVGDNTVDQYLHLGQMFPGGNAVNVAVLAGRYGHQASYLGWLGDDVHGHLILTALQAEGVDISRCRIVDGPNAYSQVRLVDGDRVFGEASSGVCEQLALTAKDLAFVREHDLVHTSVYSHIEADLYKLSQAAAYLSFDFSQHWRREYLVELLPSIDAAIFSCPDYSDADTEALLQWANRQGPELILVTRGQAGAMVSVGGRLYRQNIVPTQVVDTLGAGDAFIARFLVEYLSQTPVERALAHAADSAAQTCRYYGAFGYGVPMAAAGEAERKEPDGEP